MASKRQGTWWERRHGPLPFGSLDTTTIFFFATTDIIFPFCSLFLGGFSIDEDGKDDWRIMA